MISDKALTTPTNTQHLMELKEFVSKAQETDLPLLQERMTQAGSRCVSHFTPVHTSESMWGDRDTIKKKNFRKIMSLTVLCNKG